MDRKLSAAVQSTHKNSVDRFIDRLTATGLVQIDVRKVLDDIDGISFDKDRHAELANLLEVVANCGEAAANQKTWIRTEVNRAHQAATELVSAIDALDMMIREQFRLASSDREAILRIHSYTQRIFQRLSSEPTRKGPNKGALFDYLIDGLVVIYEKAGGRPGGSWGNPECTILDGPFYRFVGRVWESLPQHARPRTSEALKRRAKKRLSQSRSKGHKLSVS